MSSGAQDDSSQQPAVDRASRRNSLGRALDRFRNFFTTRDSNRAVSTEHLDLPSTAQPNTVREPAVEDAGVTSTAALTTSPPKPHSEPGHPENALEVDETAVDDFDDAEEPIIPVDAGSTRTGISEEKARLLSEKYGLRYEGSAQRQQKEPPGKIRRVERPVRIRLRWSCHECNTAFAHNKECSSCGHTRCGDCNRSPPQRVLRLLEKTKREKEAADLRERAASASPEDDVVPGPSTTILTEKVRDEISEPALQPAEEEALEADPLKFVYTIRSASLGGVGGVELYHLDPRKPRSRRPDVPTPEIQRVFKQPRQRVRWTCDRCSAVFTNRERCSNCQHERCEDCIRNPYVATLFYCYQLIVTNNFLQSEEKQATNGSLRHTRRGSQTCRSEPRSPLSAACRSMSLTSVLCSFTRPTLFYTSVLSPPDPSFYR